MTEHTIETLQDEERRFPPSPAFAAQANAAADIYDEPFEAFGRRVLAGLEAVAEDLGRTETAVVVSSAGAISWVTASALDGGAPVWTRLQRVIANASVTTLTVGASGPTLRTFNDTSHFDQHPDLLTLR